MVRVCLALDCGVPEDFITYLPSLIGTMQPIQYQSCFISDRSQNNEFARRLHEKMRGEKRRVWFAPEDRQGGQKLIEQIDRAIPVNDRLLLVVLEHTATKTSEVWKTSEVCASCVRGGGGLARTIGKGVRSTSGWEDDSIRLDFWIFPPTDALVEPSYAIIPAILASFCSPRRSFDAPMESVWGLVPCFFRRVGSVGRLLQSARPLMGSFCRAMVPARALVRSARATVVSSFDEPTSEVFPQESGHYFEGMTFTLMTPSGSPGW